MPPEKIRKRDGRIVPFDKKKIVRAIYRAMLAAGEGSLEAAEQAADMVVKAIDERFPGQIPGVEDIQDIVEETLIRMGYARTAKAYIIYRRRRTEVREAKRLLGVYDDLKLTLNAIRVLKHRYLLKDEHGNIIETPSQMFWRVAKAIASADKHYGGDPDKTAKTFYEVMKNLEFLPNSPTLMNAGTPMGQLSACFVIPVEDSIEGIFDALKYMAIVHKSGGGTGFSFSKLRPKGDLVRSTMGVASGPVSFMKIFDVATEVIKQGGKRRGANMGILRVDHPDIVEFITAKSMEGILENFNISVAVTDKFMEAVKKEEDYELINPRTGEAVKTLPAKDVFELMVASAWSSGDPGLIFIDEINRKNPTPELGQIEATNPCGEVPLLPFESCNLGSINLSKMVDGGEINWEKLEETVRIAVHFLDNVIDINEYPIPQIREATLRTRKIGLGVMGFAEMLIKMGVPYNSEEALRVAEKVMSFIWRVSKEKSVELAEQRGSFPAIDKSIWPKMGYSNIRNATTTAIAPTGTISIIAGTTSSIEPLFAVVYVREVLEGARLLEVNPLFEEIARERGFYSYDLVRKIAKTGSLQNIPEVPDDVKELFITALDLPVEWHVKMQATFQKHVDNAVAKTINLPQHAPADEIRKAFMLAYELKCKGVTVYRYGSKRKQVLYVSVEPEEAVIASSEYEAVCPKGVCEL